MVSLSVSLSLSLSSLAFPLSLFLALSRSRWYRAVAYDGWDERIVAARRRRLLRPALLSDKFLLLASTALRQRFLLERARAPLLRFRPATGIAFLPTSLRLSARANLRRAQENQSAGSDERALTALLAVLRTLFRGPAVILNIKEAERLPSQPLIS